MHALLYYHGALCIVLIKRKQISIFYIWITLFKKLN
uniref:Uncharacterized protein n=1 Tax=Arundo donax TaxID=35708 RepID=A0A0A8ZDD0_ARUDO